MKRVLLAIVLILSSNPALGETRKYWIVGDGPVAIWPSERSAVTGSALIRAGQSDLASRHAACVVAPGTRVVVVAGAWETIRITVIDGPKRGCEGNVYSRNVTYEPTAEDRAAAAERDATIKALDASAARAKAEREAGALCRAAMQDELAGFNEQHKKWEDRWRSQPGVWECHTSGQGRSMKECFAIDQRKSEEEPRGDSFIRFAFTDYCMAQRGFPPKYDLRGNPWAK